MATEGSQARLLDSSGGPLRVSGTLFVHPDINGAVRERIPTIIIDEHEAMARLVGAEVRHLKLHGALANMASEDAAMAEACYRAALKVDPEIIIVVLAATEMERVVRDLGCNWAGEIFADRAYNDDATLVDRRKPGAVIHDGEVAAERMLGMLAADAIITESGKHIPTRIDTICLHGDTPGAAKMARVIRERLIAGGITIERFAARNRL